MTNPGKNTVKNEHILILTATINTRNMASTSRNDPEIRLNDYENSLKQWISSRLFNNIIFCENSGHDLRTIKYIADKYTENNSKIEILSFKQPENTLHLGKGYGETQILTHIIQESKVFTPDMRAVKVTGRLYVRNASKLIAGLKANPGPSVLCTLSRNLTYSDSRVFAASRTFLEQYLCPMSAILNDPEGINFETGLARAVHQAMASGLTWAQLPILPDIRGFSGTQNTEYRTSRAQWFIANSIRHIRGKLLARN